MIEKYLENVCLHIPYLFAYISKKYCKSIKTV
jgi:hypothetical protein